VSVLLGVGVDIEFFFKGFVDYASAEVDPLEVVLLMLTLVGVTYNTKYFDVCRLFLRK
jgi:hypothetical protein